ncbi:MAG: hypothetical protein IT429_21040 [Gemmataceae bacterium]|nr:hypothetical protein [Gemmataceae bacterium]
MKRLLILSCLLTLATTSRASAQYGNFVRPSVSPYAGSGALSSPLSPMLNLRLGTNPAVNFFSGVVPAQRMRAFTAQALTTEPAASSVRPELLVESGDTLPTLPETGHPTRFLNYGSYFNLAGPGGTQRAGFLSPTPFRAPPRR